MSFRIYPTWVGSDGFHRPVAKQGVVVTHQALPRHDGHVGVGHDPCEKRTPLFFEWFPYVCPEPVSAKCSFLYTNGAKSGVVRTESIHQPQAVQKGVRHAIYLLRSILV